MDYMKISTGNDIPFDVNVIIENPMGGEPVKYEIDKESGAMFVDRFLHTAMYYPGNYGFIPHTLSGDGDPVDVLVITRQAVVPGSVMRVRPVGVLLMEDDGGIDEKIIAVPHASLYPYHDNVDDVEQIRPILREKISHFFKHYKDLEPNKWSKVLGWGDAQKAGELISEGVERYKNSL
ncbi:MAG: inorganic diphosphatase [Alphaproteobacteria bacterium]|nr:inorganic diphosphatase [Alphaproteobacteria bacterium]MCB9984466.1 inorganic diphosphatase [Micavibrio sp.]MCB1551452.1 inorganic diphosphatase [Alphaproteobacteria bacterium]HPQ51035.1 inorganic diphosphatase [Alphaproteobacteria bacterium]HRK97768.1 inorganic diphosphatase [Alphaproteobacteria bacterium]